MNPSFDTELPVDRWAVRLDEPPAGPLESVAHASDIDDGDAVRLPCAFTLEMPSADFQPRLSRFGEAA